MPRTTSASQMQRLYPAMTVAAVLVGLGVLLVFQI